MPTPAGVTPPTEAQMAEAEAKLGTSPQGHGRLWIEDSRVSRSPEAIEGKNYGRIDWLRFRVEIAFPDFADSLPMPHDYELPEPLVTRCAEP